MCSKSSVWKKKPQTSRAAGVESGQGAATSYATAMKHPGLVQGIAGLVGFVPGDCGRMAETAVLRDLPIFMAVGKQDTTVPYEQSQICAETLKNAEHRPSNIYSYIRYILLYDRLYPTRFPISFDYFGPQQSVHDSFARDRYSETV